MKRIIKCVLTGGPCAGKTTALKCMQKHFTEKGFRVLTVSETATDLLSGGISPFNMDNITFQYIVTSTMRFKESMMQLAAETVDEDNVLIICDRAQMDNTAYMTEEQLSALMQRMNTNIVEMRDGYDAVFHLETAALGDKKAYDSNFLSNEARYESAREATETDHAILKGWTGHPHLRIIPAFTDFDAKMERLLEEAETAFISGTETERKFLIEKPTEEEISALPFARRIEIEQCYIDDESGKFRIRRRGEGGAYIYTHTEKHKISDITRTENEWRISCKEYEDDKKRAPYTLTKDRICICEGDRYFELDIYPYSKKYAILEIELCSEDESFELPSFVRLIREVTGEKEYSNKNIAKTHKIVE